MEAMTDKSELLERRIAALIEASEDMRKVLRRFAKANAELADHIAKGEVLTEALLSVQGPVRRRETTEAMDVFEAARHKVRLAMFGLAQEQGVSISDVGRSLGFSRQLASRLAAEAAES